MRIRYDKEADILYIGLKTRYSDRVVSLDDNDIIIRIDEDSKQIVGITILQFSDFIPKLSKIKFPFIIEDKPIRKIRNILKSFVLKQRKDKTISGFSPTLHLTPQANRQVLLKK